MLQLYYQTGRVVAWSENQTKRTTTTLALKVLLNKIWNECYRIAHKQMQSINLYNIHTPLWVLQYQGSSTHALEISCEIPFILFQHLEGVRTLSYNTQRDPERFWDINRTIYRPNIAHPIWKPWFKRGTKAVRRINKHKWMRLACTIGQGRQFSCPTFAPPGRENRTRNIYFQSVFGANLGLSKRDTGKLFLLMQSCRLDVEKGWSTFAFVAFPKSLCRFQTYSAVAFYCRLCIQSRPS